MKKLGNPSNALEERAEQAIRRFAGIDAGRTTYAAAAPPVASPSYHAVESVSFNVAPDGKEPALFLRLGIDEVAELVNDDVAFAAALRRTQAISVVLTSLKGQHPVVEIVY